MKRLATLSIFTLAACSDSAGTPDGGGASVLPDASADSAPLDGGGDASVAPDDAPADATKPFVPPSPFAVVQSASGPDQWQSIAAGPGGTFFAAGYAAASPSATKCVTVARFTSAGALDTTFGTNGIVTTAVTFGGGSGEIDIALQSTGKLIVSATVADELVAADRDVAVIRLSSDGKIDTTFGVNGIRVVDLNTATDATQSAQRDAVHGLAVGTAGEIYLHCAQRGPAARTDSDFAVVKLTETGALDTAWGTSGKFTLDIGSPSANASPRSLAVLADGSVIASGYANTSVVGNTVQSVLYKLNNRGALEEAFAEKGLFHATVLAAQTEIYGFGIHGSQIVTGGYGRESGTANDFVSMRFDVTTGKLDPTWAKNGAFVFDPSGTSAGSHCRNAIALPGGRTMLIGSTGASNTPQQNAVLGFVSSSGALDTAFGKGVHALAFGTGDGGSDQLWGAALSANTVMAVGFRGAGATQTEQSNDDGYVVAFSLP
jgi:uncharacterized delta-60 repeat protein